MLMGSEGKPRAQKKVHVKKATCKKPNKKPKKKPNTCKLDPEGKLAAADFQSHLCRMQENVKHRHSDSGSPFGCSSSSAAMTDECQSPPFLADLCELLTKNLNKPSASSLGPIDITTLRRRFRAPFKGNEQQDADEFLTYILDYLETECGYEPFTAWLDILQGEVTSNLNKQI